MTFSCNMGCIGKGFKVIACIAKDTHIIFRLIAKVKGSLMHAYLSIHFADSFINLPDSLGTARSKESTHLVMTEDRIAFQQFVSTFFGKHGLVLENT